jgi:hypothetical protein
MDWLLPCFLTWIQFCWSYFTLVLSFPVTKGSLCQSSTRQGSYEPISTTRAHNFIFFIARTPFASEYPSQHRARICSPQHPLHHVRLSTSGLRAPWTPRQKQKWANQRSFHLVEPIHLAESSTISSSFYMLDILVMCVSDLHMKKLTYSEIAHRWRWNTRRRKYLKMEQ